MDECNNTSASCESAQSCCRIFPDSVSAQRPTEPAWLEGWIDTPVGKVPQLATTLSRKDKLGALKVRLCIGRMHYGIAPRLYATGNPTEDSPILVTANYKLTFDYLRRELGGLDTWVMVLDTKNINVWCAAGKGTFGTDEIVNRIAMTGLAKIVNHRILVLPQLGAPGVAAHEVKKRSGFAVKYGPVRARDIPAFLKAGMKATPELRRVRFDLPDRMAVIPVELVHWGGYAIAMALALWLLSAFAFGGQSRTIAYQNAWQSAGLVLGAYLVGGIIAPVLLPWLPGRAFSTKGAVVGFLFAGAGVLMGWIPRRGPAGILAALAWLLMIPSISAFMAMNYTGTSTYTSLSGVRREMRFAVPAQVVAGVLGIGLWVAAHFA